MRTPICWFSSSIACWSLSISINTGSNTTRKDVPRIHAALPVENARRFAQYPLNARLSNKRFIVLNGDSIINVETTIRPTRRTHQLMWRFKNTPNDVTFSSWCDVCQRCHVLRCVVWYLTSLKDYWEEFVELHFTKEFHFRYFISAWRIAWSLLRSLPNWEHHLCNREFSSSIFRHLVLSSSRCTSSTSPPFRSSVTSNRSFSISLQTSSTRTQKLLHYKAHRNHTQIKDPLPLDDSFWDPISDADCNIDKSFSSIYGTVQLHTLARRPPPCSNSDKTRTLWPWNHDKGLTETVLGIKWDQVTNSSNR